MKKLAAEVLRGQMFAAEAGLSAAKKGHPGARAPDPDMEPKETASLQGRAPGSFDKLSGTIKQSKRTAHLTAVLFVIRRRKNKA